jgi:hypothetical protein
LNVREIREIAKKYSPEQIEDCITTQIETGENICVHNEKTDVIINDLSKAGFIREQMDNGMSLADALRELALRMRQVQKTAES